MKPFEFQTVLFNFHDVMLLMTVMQCLFFGTLLYVTNTSRIKSTLFLAAFLFAHALIPANELMMWGAEFKSLVRNQWPSVHFIPGIAYYIDGLLLFFCIKSLIFRNFSLKKIDLLHLLPLLAYIIFISTEFYSHSFEQRQEMLNSESFVYSAGYVTMEFFSKWVRFFYAIACFVLIFKYKNRLQDTHSNIENVHINWLNGLVVGFMVVMLSEVILVGAKVFNLFYPLGTDMFMYLGLTGNYTSFVLVNLLIFTAIRYFLIFEQVTDDETIKKSVDDKFVNPDMAAEVDCAILKSKAYMEPDITLDKLAESLSIIPRDLSMLINRHFGINFYEFINKYRIEEAKKMLVDPEHKNTTITDIYLAVGFNSKSVFYTFFKKFESVTPSQFRQSALCK
ncbi:AraC family transcriptional regulator [Pseudoalteromonas sp. NBT06-2]|uniref:helix-turn-helix domain-containing protein n=1 Tax=Pseudoalteromonas sp. NBT06-2 TaxID=2025950 RepID=UPI000BA77DA7|nr:helix-turn-helix domain-containing protein [Pseudoalteromonas sp. NBT06-2]PAJ75078.1 AraC family transcriptional regulator [Pseudoalteromonas sp. NBT06-2]